MKPIKLTMQAFGPYAKVEEIDFRELENRTMFLISGKTGSGKTTIFDAIAFAIYGKTSGEERSGSDLRSQFATPALSTEVSLLFSLKNKIYRIIRTPQQEKKKARGDGYTTVNSKAELYELIHGEERLLAGNVREVEEKIKQIIQLDFHQFKQILMIPQGEFRKLLVSDSRDKEQILQRLFHTEIYTSFQEKLKVEAGSLKTAVENCRQERLTYFSAIDPLQNEELKELLLNEPMHENHVLKLAKDLVATQNEQKIKLNKSVTEGKKNRDHLIQDIERAVYLKNAFSQLEELKVLYSQLSRKKGEISEKKDQIDRARKAEKIWPIKVNLDEKRQKLEQRTREIEDYRKSLRIEEEALKTAKEKLDRLTRQKESIEQKKQSLQELEALAEKIQERAAIEGQLLGLKNEGIKEKNLLTKMEAQNETLQKELKQLETALSLYQSSKLSLSEKKQELQSLQFILQTTERAQKLEKNLLTHEKKISELHENQKLNEKRAAQRLEEKKRLDKQFISSQAVYLSQQLTLNEPCPVCGSLEHPSKASGEIIEVTEQELTNGTQRLQEAIALKDRGEVELKSLQQRVNELYEEKQELVVEIKKQNLSFEWTDVNGLITSLKAEIHSVKKTIDQTTKEIMEEKKTQVKKSEKEQEQEILIKNISQASESVQAKREQYIEMQGDFKRLSSSIPERYLDQDYYLSERKELIKSIKEYEEALRKTEEIVNALKDKCLSVANRLQQTIDEREKEASQADEVALAWIKSIKEHSFGSEEEVQLAKVSESMLHELEQSVQQFEKEFFATGQELSRRSKELESKSEPDLHVLEEELAKVEERLAELEKELQYISSYIERHEGLLDQIESNKNKTAALEKEYELVGHLSDMANGKNHLRITFERYVLAFYLEDILTVANDRLSKMTSGRYQLLRKVDKSKGNAQGGLELLVFDQYTGQERHVKTLSGGEAFKASLSLALGLADVVQAYSGGVSLETMFIDEGFGTLDPESLDQAIESLMEIQHSGRLVGIISHVPELKERIDARLDVESSKTGSETSFVFVS
ncbi:AAA family ATPase [Jeotgalibacillus proteolyticus]|uniref:Nuclease SbcCD subunit C n=1 Tax=Jeotgalibacillus proteolyticus TaxID=2082395 RepID=A0A2S5GGA7_9BACL|nr:SbcC/MukB-like Walker B domain-containing protein [Jeotgalibacillus proteolyticus]PPA71954.1 ATP-dependent dsDNA exonuclease [Jeotgalibacillus proteolyticus]